VNPVVGAADEDNFHMLIDSATQIFLQMKLEEVDFAELR